MRRHMIWALALTLLCSACHMYDNLPVGEDKPALYLTKEAQVIEDLLTSSQYGWRLVLLPGSYQYGGINFAFNFHKGGAVETYSEDSESTEHSSYRIYNTAGIRLTFDTRNLLLGRYAEPQNTLLQGLEGDFEFTFGAISEDRNSIELVGAYTHNRMKLVRLTEAPESYLAKVRQVRQALYGKSLATATIGGEQVKMSVFGLIRQLQVKVGEQPERLAPIYFTPEGIELIAPEDPVDAQDASQGKVGQLGTVLLRSLALEREGDNYHVVTPAGDKLEVQTPYLDLTQQKIRVLFYQYWAGKPLVDLMLRVNGLPYTSGPLEGRDSIPGEKANDMWYQDRTTLSEFAYIGRTDGGDHKISLQYFGAGGRGWTSYYLDFAGKSDEPEQFYVRRFVQNGDDWRLHRAGMTPIIDALVAHSPYTFYWRPNTTYEGQYDFFIRSEVDQSFWMCSSAAFDPEAPLSSMTVYNQGSRF